LPVGERRAVSATGKQQPDNYAKCNRLQSLHPAIPLNE
jgi:hypothetical protein